MTALGNLFKSNVQSHPAKAAPVLKTLITMLPLIALTSSVTLAQDDSGEPENKKQPLITWQTNGLDVLHSPETFAFEGDKHTTLTAWHADGWKYGDNYAFIDVTNTGAYYGEVLPRLSASKLLNKNISLGPIKDVLLAGNFEFPEDMPVRSMIGVGTDIDIKGFDFFKQNFYLRDNPLNDGVTWQSTTEFGATLKPGKHLVAFNGFIDIAGAEGDAAFNIVSQPRILVDIGNYFNKVGAGKMFLGTEAFYWHNKFGIEADGFNGVDKNGNELNIQAALVVQI